MFGLSGLIYLALQFLQEACFDSTTCRKYQKLFILVSLSVRILALFNDRTRVIDPIYVDLEVSSGKDAASILQRTICKKNSKAFKIHQPADFTFNFFNY